MSKGNLKSVLEGLNKTYGDGAVMRGENDAVNNIKVCSSGSLTLDVALGVGGYPYGRIIEIYGPESSGKTTLAIHAIAEVQKEGGTAAFIDAEHAFDKFYAQNLGVNMEELIISQPDNGEQALEITEKLIGSGEINIIVIDSVAALTPKAEIDGAMGEAKIGLHARLMSQAMRKLTGIISNNEVIVIFINQLREKIGVMFGSPEFTPGGNALKFYSSIRLDCRRRAVLKNKDDKDVADGNTTVVKVKKNKVAPPFTQAEFDIMFGQGICRISEVLTLGVQYEIIDKSGSWYSYKGDKLGQGKEGVRVTLEDNIDLAIEIESEIRKTLLI